MNKQTNVKAIDDYPAKNSCHTIDNILFNLNLSFDYVYINSLCKFVTFKKNDICHMLICCSTTNNIFVLFVSELFYS